MHVADAANAATRWSNQPYINPTLYSRVTANKGSTGCPAGTLSFDVKALVQHHADVSSPVQAYAITASETDTLGLKLFSSSEAASGRPSLSATYNIQPITPGTPTHTPGLSSNAVAPGSTTTTTPTLQTSVSDLDGGTVKGLFSVYLNGESTPLIDKMAGSSVTGGGVSTLVVPAGKLVNGSTYVVRVYANDGLLTSEMAVGYDRFTVDPTAMCAVSGSRAAAQPLSHQLSDSSNMALNPTNGNLLVSGSLLHLRGVGQDLSIGWRYNAISDTRPTLTTGFSEAALQPWADGSFSYIAPAATSSPSPGRAG